MLGRYPASFGLGQNELEKKKGFGWGWLIGVFVAGWMLRGFSDYPHLKESYKKMFPKIFSNN